MGLFTNKQSGGAMDVIRCDEQDYLVWKWRPNGAELGQTSRENAIRWGSSLRVKEGSVAIFVHSGTEGVVQDYIVGPADTIIDTKNLPLISSFVGMAYNGNSPFQAEIYFVNMANTIQVKFAVPYDEVSDFENPLHSVPVAIRGSLDFNIRDYRHFISTYGLTNFTIDDLTAKIKDAVCGIASGIIKGASHSYQISVIRLGERTKDIKNDIYEELSQKVYQHYGVNLLDVNIANIDIDRNSDGYKKLMAISRDLQDAEKKNESRTNRFAKSIHKIGNSAVDVKEDQYERHLKTQDKYADVLENERAGKFGAVTGKLLRDIGLKRGSKKSVDSTPPPIPMQDAYHIAVNGQSEGPYDLVTLEQLVENGQVSKSTLVWKKGMKEWLPAGTVDALKYLFDEMPPIPQ